MVQSHGHALLSCLTTAVSARTGRSVKRQLGLPFEIVVVSFRLRAMSRCGDRAAKGPLFGPRIPPPRPVARMCDMRRWIPDATPGSR